ncbi:integrase arm-type DNA-binding domain-containing protein [Noviherbaspirillum sp. 1P10PC]|uniref:tyrosine-type recombinase/integrase n=1 Tax=Noviherbaspirillum sp. 1P10PC TaxID=3132292 RepID=UPI00399EEDC0
MGSRRANLLTAVAVNAKRDPGYYPDGNGLYLQISASGSKSWVLRFSLNKKAREMGLGSIVDRTLSEAREQAKKYRQQLAEGIDPIDARKAQRQANLLATMSRKTFTECAHEYHKLHAKGWKNPKHVDQWINTLTTYAFPIFGNKDVSVISKGEILQALEPIWQTKTETASRVKQRIRAVLDWAAARDYRSGHDPRLWDQVDRSLPKAKSIKKVSHFAACPYVSALTTLLTIRSSAATDTVKDAFEFAVLTAARSGEARGARWDEIDFESRRWIIPAERMKAKREHRVPLSGPVVEILERRRKAGNDSPLIFASDRQKPLSDMVFTMLLRREGFDYTMHGFRSTFRDWSAEQTSFPREVCEAALAHTTKDATEAAYFRSDLFEKRRELMEAWGSYCSAPTQELQNRNSND